MVELNRSDFDFNSGTFLTQLFQRISEAGLKSIELTDVGPRPYQTVLTEGQYHGMTAIVVSF